MTHDTMGAFESAMSKASFSTQCKWKAPARENAPAMLKWNASNKLYCN